MYAAVSFSGGQPWCRVRARFESEVALTGQCSKAFLNFLTTSVPLGAQHFGFFDVGLVIIKRGPDAIPRHSGLFFWKKSLVLPFLC